MFDVIVIGGGVAGLMSAYKFTQIGLSVAVIEKSPTLASGPSTRNEGWLHRGSYHAASIADRTTAIQVAQRCIYGHEQLLSFCPEAIEDRDKRPLAMLADGHRTSEVMSRWDEAGVYYRQLTTKEAQARCETADFSRAATQFEVKDVSINTRLLYRKLVAQAKYAGCEFYLGCEIQAIDGTQVVVVDGDAQRRTLSAQKILYTAGGGAAALLQRFHAVTLPVRYWKSHLVVTRRLADMGVFYLDPNQAAMMHHGEVSVIGFNEDALLSETPDYDVIPERANNLRLGIGRIFPNWRPNGAIDVACVKVDLAVDRKDARSLNIAIQEPVKNHIVALPGKLTETPYLTDILASKIHGSIEEPLVAKRPCDAFETNALAAE